MHAFQKGSLIVLFREGLNYNNYNQGLSFNSLVFFPPFFEVLNVK